MNKIFGFIFLYLFIYNSINSKQNIKNFPLLIENSIINNITLYLNNSLNIKEQLKYNYFNNTRFNMKQHKINDKFNSSLDILNNNYSFSYNNINFMKKNLVIGVVTHYNWDIIEPFFKSFKKAKFENCDCVIFIDAMNVYTINKC